MNIRDFDSKHHTQYAAVLAEGFPALMRAFQRHFDQREAQVGMAPDSTGENSPGLEPRMPAALRRWAQDRFQPRPRGGTRIEDLRFCRRCGQSAGGRCPCRPDRARTSSVSGRRP